MNKRAFKTIVAATLMTGAILIAWSRIGRAVDLTFGPGFPGIESSTTDAAQLVRVFPKLKFSQPLFLTTTPDSNERFFVVEKSGRILSFANQPDVSETHTFLRIPVRSGGEQGLLGLAFPPDHGTSGFFYVYYTPEKGPRRSVLSRFRVTEEDPSTADPASEQVLLEVPQPYSNHNGGMLCFGADGDLYLGLGDGGSAGDPKGHGQNTGSLLGSILRIRPTATGYEIPSDNPFAKDPGQRPEIYAWGLRNPWRFSFDRETGALWVGDVGQNRREEISIVENGDNLGWDAYEGELTYERAWKHRKLTFKRPVLTYAPSIGYSVTGGYVYRGTALPGFRGCYIYGDYGSGKVWALRREDGFVVSNTELGTVPSLASFGEDHDGELYAISLGGKVWKLAKR